VRQDTIPTQDIPRKKRSNLLPMLLTGGIIGLVIGAPIGWFSHRVFFQYRSAQVLLCRQQNFGLAEVQLQAKCGSLY